MWKIEKKSKSDIFVEKISISSQNFRPKIEKKSKKWYFRRKIFDFESKFSIKNL